MLDLIRALCLVAGLGPVVVPPEGVGLEAWLPSLRVGMWVKVEGRHAPDGVLEAARIKLYGAGLDEVTLESSVSAVDVPRLAIQTSIGVRIMATPQTEIERPSQRSHVGLARLEVGDRIKVAGQLQKDGSIVAEEIEIEESRPLEAGTSARDSHELTAPIESIDTGGRRIMVLGLRIRLAEGTRVRSSLPD